MEDHFAVNEKIPYVQAARDFAGFILRKRFCENDIDGLNAHCNAQMRWIGISKYEPGAEDCRIISGEEYDVQEIAEDTYLVSGSLYISGSKQQMSMLVRWMEGKPRCAHLHLSSPEENADIFLQQKQLAAEMEELSSIFNTMPYGIVRLLRKDGKHSLITFNQALIEMMERSGHETRRMDWSPGFCGDVVPEDIPRLIDSLTGLQKPGDRLYTDYRVFNHMGKVIHLSSNNTLVSEDARGQVIQRIIFDISKQKELESYLRRMSYEDSLTGLYNRNRLNYYMEEYQPGSRLGVAFFDLNNLKKTNDQHGHSAGDKLIFQTARQINHYFPAKTYRAGGDEFLVIEDGLDEADFCARIASITTSLEARGISVSVGISWRDSHCSIKAQMEEADQNMYNNKAAYHSNRNG